MPLLKPDEFYAKGSKVFRKAPVNRSAIQGWVQISQGKVSDAMKPDNSPGTRLGAAYDSVLNLSLAVLASKGWRVSSAEGHHAQSLEAACSYAGVTESVFNDMDAVRDLRNNQYDGVPASQDDVKFAIVSMERLVPPLLHMLKEHLTTKS